MSRKKNSQYLKGAFCQIYIRPCSFGQSSAAVNAKNVRPSKLYLGVNVLLDWHILVAWCTSLPYICMQQLSWVRCVPQSFPQNTDRAEEDGIVVQDHFWSSSPNPWRSYWAFLHGNKQSSPSRHREFGKSPWSAVPEYETYFYSKILRNSNIEKMESWNPYCEHGYHGEPDKITCPR